MKRLIAMTGLCAILYPAFSQNISFGPRFGLNITDVTVNGDRDKARMRLHMGVFGNYEINEFISAQAEIIYSEQGNYQLGNLSGPSSLNYINIPLMGKVTVLDKIGVYAGPQIGIAVKAKFKSESSGRVYVVDDVLAPLDISFLLGVDYEVIDGLSAGIRYHGSLGDTHQDDARVGKNKVLLISLAYDIAGFVLK